MDSIYYTMIYLDNAATSRFKPKCVIDALLSDVKNSANSGRSGHKASLSTTLAVENARNYFKEAFEFDNVVFTKNCTEALNLAIFGFVKNGMTVVTTENEHNSVLRPLYQLKSRGIVNLVILPVINAQTPFEELIAYGKEANLIVVSNASNVLGSMVDVLALKDALKGYPVKILVDGAQGVPYADINGRCADMIALPAHKGLHGIQGVGALLFNNNIKLKPLVYGGTGTESFNLLQPDTIPDGLESGTLFSGGIRAFQEGAKWTYDNIKEIRYHVKRLATECAYGLKNLGIVPLNNEYTSGIVTFNVGDIDSQLVAGYLDQRNIAVRGGIHCAPLIHKRLNTDIQGAVRISFGVDNNEKDMLALLSSVERFIAKLEK